MVPLMNVNLRKTHPTEFHILAADLSDLSAVAEMSDPLLAMLLDKYQSKFKEHIPQAVPVRLEYVPGKCMRVYSIKNPSDLWHQLLDKDHMDIMKIAAGSTRLIDRIRESSTWATDKGRPAL
jgi:hypothetical protein